MNEHIGRFYLSPDDPATGKPDESITPAQAKKLTAQELAGMTVIDEDGKEVSGKEFTESRRRQPDLNKKLADERAAFDAQRTRMEAEFKERESKLSEAVKQASNEGLDRMVNALLQASGRRAPNAPMTKADKIAFITEKMQTEGWTAGVADIVGELADADTASDTKVANLEKKLREEYDGKLAAAKKEALEQAQLLVFQRDEIAAIRKAYPEYDTDPETDDARSHSIQVLLKKEKPDEKILGGLVGIDTPADKLVKLVLTHHSKKERDRIKSEDESEKKAKDGGTTTPSGRPSFKVPDDIQEAIAKATTMDELHAARRRLIEAQR